MIDTSNPDVLFEKRGNIAVITLNSPRTRNAIGWTLGGNLVAALDQAENDDDVRAVVLTASGPTFCAGAKVGEMIHPDGVDVRRRDKAILNGQKAVRRLRTMDLPVVAAIKGTSVGGGVALAMACDLVVAAEDAAYYFAFGRVGCSAADYGCSHMLSRVIGTARSRHILLTGATIDSRRGLELGLFVDVVNETHLLERALELAGSVAASAPREAVAATKQILLRNEDVDFDACLYFEHAVQTHFLNSEQHRKAVGTMLDGLKKKNG